jgi:sulfur carrier protein ThiS adenylyltransferase
MKNFEKEYFSKHDPQILPILRASTIGIAGAGGLGSNVAVSLTRAGIGRIIVADSDVIEPSNLNRQQYFISQIGMPKVEALRVNLKKISRFTECEAHHVRLTKANIPKIFDPVDIMVEALDRAKAKEMLLDCWISHFPLKPIIIASGLAGFGLNKKLHTRKIGDLYICGDEESECRPGVSPMAPRVALVANMQANLVLELLIKPRRKHA